MRRLILLTAAVVTLTAGCDTMMKILGIKTPEQLEQEGKKKEPPVIIRASVRSLKLRTGGASRALNVTIRGGKASEIKWSNSTPTLANLNAAGQAGIITPQAGGNGVIKISHPRANDTILIPYVVEAPRAVTDTSDTSTYLRTTNLAQTINVNQTVTLRAVLVNASVADRLDIQWSTEDSDVVKMLNSQGPEIAVRGLKAGTASIQASHAKSKNVLTFSLFTPESGKIYLIPAKTAYMARVGDTIPVATTLYGVRSAVENLAITWQSEDPTIAQLVGNTGASIQVIAKKVGTTTISPSHSSAVNSPSITIHISAARTRQQDVKYLATRKTALEMQINTNENLRARLVGGNQLDEQSITWTVSDHTIVQLVGSSGNEIIAKGLLAGEAVITASHPDSVNTLRITINVRAAVRRLSLSRTAIVFKPGETGKILRLEIKNGFPADYNNITWSTSNNAVAAIFGSGRSVQINPGDDGNTTITAKLNTTGQTVKSIITVLPQRYIILPANIAVEKGKSVTFDVDFAPPGSRLAFMTSRNGATTVTQKGKKVTLEGLTEGHSTLTVSGTGGRVARMNVNVYVNRSLSLEGVISGNILNIEPYSPEKTVTLKVVPSHEVGLITVSNTDQKLMSVIHDPKTGTIKIRTKKEGEAQIMINDNKRSGGIMNSSGRVIAGKALSQKIPILVKSEIEDITKLIKPSHTGKKTLADTSEDSVADSHKPFDYNFSLGLPAWVTKNPDFEVRFSLIQSAPDRTSNSMSISPTTSKTGSTTIKTSAHYRWGVPSRRYLIDGDIHYVIKYGLYGNKTYEYKGKGIRVHVSGFTWG